MNGVYKRVEFRVMLEVPYAAFPEEERPSGEGDFLRSRYRNPIIHGYTLSLKGMTP